MMDRREYSRREFGRLLGGMFLSPLAIALAGCAPRPPQPVNTPKPEIKHTPIPTPEISDKGVRAKVNEIAASYPVTSPFRGVYLPGIRPKGISYAVFLPVQTGLITEAGTHAETQFGAPVYGEPILKAEIGAKNQIYKKVESRSASIKFSPNWLKNNLQLQRLIMEKEAYALLMWQDFCNVAMTSFKNQGGKLYAVGSVDPTPEQVAEIIGLDLYQNNLQAHSLYDYAGYLAVMPQVDVIMTSGNFGLQQQLDQTTNIVNIWRVAKDAKINFNLDPQSQAFREMAFSKNSQWAKIILSPDIPGLHNKK